MIESELCKYCWRPYASKFFPFCDSCLKDIEWIINWSLKKQVNHYGEIFNPYIKKIRENLKSWKAACRRKEGEEWRKEDLI